MRKLLLMVVVILLLAIAGCTTPGCPDSESVQCFFGYGYGDGPAVEALP